MNAPDGLAGFLGLVLLVGLALRDSGLRPAPVLVCTACGLTHQHCICKDGPAS